MKSNGFTIIIPHNYDGGTARILDGNAAYKLEGLTGHTVIRIPPITRGAEFSGGYIVIWYGNGRKMDVGL